MKTTRRAFLGSMAATACLPLIPGASFGLEGDSDGFILGQGPKGHCDEKKNGGPSVHWNEPEQEWWMWYYGRSADFPEGVAPAFGTENIALARSKDGIHWERYKGHLKGGAIMRPSEDPDAFDAIHVGVGNVIRHKDEWILFYFGGDSTVVPEKLGDYEVVKGYQYKGYRCRPGIARSKDGVNWERIKGKAYGGAAVDIGDNIYGAFPSGFHDGKRFILHYTVLSPRMFYWETRVAASTDLVNWQDLGTLNWEDEMSQWELGGMVSRNVIPNPDKNGPKFLMIYSGLDSRYKFYPRKVGAAVSDDGINWRHLYKDPIFSPGPLNSWDSGGTAYSSVVPAGNKLHLYYYGYADSANVFEPKRGIGMAVSETGDLRDFRRVKANI